MLLHAQVIKNNIRVSYESTRDLEGDESRVLEVDQKGLLVNQFLNNLSSNSKHSKTSVLELTDLVVNKLSLTLGPPSNRLDFSISAGPRLGFDKTDSLETGENSKGEGEPDGVGVEGLKSTSGGGKEIISESAIVSTLLRDHKSKEGHLGETSMHDLNLTVTGKLGVRGLCGETGGVEEPYRRKSSNESIGGDGLRLRSLLGRSLLLHGTGGGKVSGGATVLGGSEGSGGAGENGEEGELHGR
mmetsp:Transcript_12937/g.25174  ORF Transcript_12937/g.25174 Transcript_12937/m.25174 type:complete len:243 (+) Transcript_12937:234-962(+)